MICVFSPRSSRRLEYVLHHLIEEMWGESLLLLTDEEVFSAQAAEGKINYSGHPVPGAFFIPAHTLLFEEDIHNQEIQLLQGKEFPYCFPLSRPDADMDWDVFAACFYWLSRYEEYLPFRADKHGRFTPEASLACRNGCLHTALADRWAEHLQQLLKQRFPGLRFAERKATFTPTYDIDIAYAYLHKGLPRTVGGLLRTTGKLLKSAFYDWDVFSEDIRKRWRAFTGRANDPYDTFDALQQLHRDEKLHPIYFVLFAPRSRYDKGISPKKPAFRQKIMSLAQEAEIGIHASYAASSEKEPLRLYSEKEALAAMLQRPVTANRFHYLHFRLPESYRMLLQAGITDDYSMGFVTAAGFRAGTCKPFYFFDLERNETTPLRIHPLLFMENAFFKESPDIQMSARPPFKGHVPLYDQQPPKAAQLFEEIRPLLDECIRFRGEIITLFHNQSFGELPGHDLPAKEVYTQIINYIHTALCPSDG
ncbi:MAG: polysaccharide deacetylase family protein [Bacteroidales bacterium]|nr:polysaccharide deacetylase family protein [Bacteroidales bacterium]